MHQGGVNVKYRLLIMIAIFTLGSIPAIYKMHDFYQSYVFDENKFLDNAKEHRRQLLSGERNFTKEQLANMYIIAAESTVSRYGMKFYFYLSLGLLIHAFLMYIFGFVSGYRTGRKKLKGQPR
jgi:hypothetical protein